MRRMIAALLTLCVTVATVSDPAGLYEVKAAEAQDANTEGMDILEAESGDFRYMELPNGSLEIIKYRGNATKLVIPSEIEGKKVVKIGRKAFSGCRQLTSITIPESIKEIHYYSWEWETECVCTPFDDCENLTEIIVEENNTWYSSQNGILYDKNKTKLLYCPRGRIGSITIPKSVTDIEKSSFYERELHDVYYTGYMSNIVLGNVSHLTEIVVEDGNTKYSSLDGMLYNKNGTELLCCPVGKKGSITIPKGVTGVGSIVSPFYKCSGLTSITIPESVSFIGVDAFFGCSNLTDIVVDEKNESYDTLNGILYEKQQGFQGSKIVLVHCPAGKQGNVIIPDGKAERIGQGAFYGCNGLESITIPKSIADIAYREGGNVEYAVFKGCNSLTQIIVDEENVNYRSSDGMLYFISSKFGNSGAGLVCCPAGKRGNVAVKAGTTYIKKTAFSDCHELENVLIPNSVTGIDEDDYSWKGLFSDCTSLNEIIVDENSRSLCVQDGILYDDTCEYLISCPASKQGSIIVPQGVTRISRYAFDGCKKLTEINVERNNKIFASLNGMLYKKGEDGALSEMVLCPAGKEGSITVADGVYKIGDCAFKNCLGVKEIVMPDSIQSIGDGAFSGCEDNVCIRCVSGSYAEKYAKERGMDYALIEKKRQTITAYDHVKTVGDAAFPLGADTDGNARLSYESGDASVASVSINGIVTIHGQGTAYITITAAETTEYEAAQKIIMITVNPAPGTGENPTPPEDMIGTSHLIGGTAYTITSVDPKEARVTSVTNLNEEETLTSIAIASIVTMNGIDYQVTSIADKAFQGMETLERAFIGSYVRTIGEDAFKGCKNLTKISVSGENETYSFYEGCLYSRDYSRLIICPAGKASVKLKDGLSGIGEKDFAGCQKLAAIEIPESVTDIAEGAFADCGEDLCIICAKGSAAEAYAIAHSLRYETAQEGKKPQMIVASDYVKTVGDAAFSIEAIASGGGELSYKSGNEAVVIVSAKGTAAVIGAGTAVITITAAETDEHEAAQKVITITVNPKSSTGNNNQQNSGNKKEQTITAADIAKTYGDRQFPIGAVADSGGALSYAVKNPAVAAIDGNGIITLKGCGRTEVAITAAAHGEYKAAEKTITLTVSPKKLKGISAKSTKAGTLTVKWKKDTAASGYIIECSTDRKFRKNVKAATVKKNKTTSKKITKLKSGKKYYVRACAYAQAGGTKIRGAYASGKKAVKVKK